LQDHSVSDDLKTRLGYILEIRQFAEHELFLPVENNYSTFVDLQRAHVVWNVFAAPEFSIDPLSWCYPIAGCVSYRGYFSESRALDYANKLEQRGFDVYTGGVDAYSTLGWFEDPIRPSMLRGDDEGIINLVLHEAAHGVLYWKGQTDFNESFASFVGDTGTVRYLEDRLGPACEPCLQAQTARADAPRFSALIAEVVERLNLLYDEPVSREEKLRRREEVFDWAKERYGEIPWEGSTFDYFQQRDLDNAVILSYRRYDSGQGTFDALLEQCNNDLVAAIHFVQGLDWPSLPRAQRRQTTPMDWLQEKLDEGIRCD